MKTALASFALVMGLMGQAFGQCDLLREYDTFAQKPRETEAWTTSEMEGWVERLRSATPAQGEDARCARIVISRYAVLLRELGRHQEALDTFRAGMRGTTDFWFKLEYANNALGIVQIIHGDSRNPEFMRLSREIAVEALADAPTLEALLAAGDHANYSSAFPIAHARASTTPDAATKEHMLRGLLASSTLYDDQARAQGKQQLWKGDRINIAHELYELLNARSAPNPSAPQLSELLALLPWEDDDTVMGKGSLLRTVTTDHIIPLVVRETVADQCAAVPGIEEHLGTCVGVLAGLWSEGEAALSDSKDTALWTRQLDRATALWALCGRVSVPASGIPRGFLSESEWPRVCRDALRSVWMTAFHRVHDCGRARAVATEFIQRYPADGDVPNAQRVVDKCR